MRSPSWTRACWMWRGFFSSCRYSVSCWSERWRPNQVFHQNRNGMSTMSHPVVKKRIFWVRDMLRLGLVADGAVCGVSLMFGDWLRFWLYCRHPEGAQVLRFAQDDNAQYHHS